MRESKPTGERSLWIRAVIIGFLLLATVQGQIDRMIVNILLEPIKADLGASDTQMGLLTGFYFVAFYVLLGFPIARLADKYSRRAIISLCIAAWSVATIVSGTARSYTQLALARVFVAAGEGGSSPAVYSLVADIFPLQQRTRAIGLIASGSALGAGAGVLLGGVLQEELGWRLTFIIVGLPGLLLAPLLFWILPEPRRGMPKIEHAKSMLQVMITLWKIPSFPKLASVTVAGAIPGFAVLAWTPAFLSRVHGMSHSEIGIKLGLATTIGLFLGNVSAGVIADMLARRDVRWLIWTAAMGLAFCMPAGLFFTLTGNANLAVIGFGVFAFFLAFWPPAVTASVLGIADEGSRAVATVFYQLFLAIGGAIGPLAVGYFNDTLFADHGDLAVRYSLAVVMSTCLVGAGLAYLTGLRIDRDIDSSSRLTEATT